MTSDLFFIFFFNDTATTEIYTLSLHDALPILPPAQASGPASPNATADADIAGKFGSARSTAILGNLLKNRGK